RPQRAARSVAVTDDGAVAARRPARGRTTSIPRRLVVWLAGAGALPLALLVIAACGGGGHIQNLPLRWGGVRGRPQPSAPVARAVGSGSMSFGLRDMRAAPSAVGVYQDSGFIVRTSDNVGQYCTDRMGEMLVHAGARLNPAPSAALEAELIDYHVI